MSNYSTKRVYLKEISLRQSVSFFLIRDNLVTETENITVETFDTRQPDGSYIISTLCKPGANFVYNGIEMKYVINVMGNTLPSRQQIKESIVPEEHYIETPDIDVCLDLIKRASDDKSSDDINKSTLVWNARSELWLRDGSVCHRSMDSVILDKKIKSTLLKDLEDFNSCETINWYKKHGIPFKRGYLFYGKPGTGKTSTITAISSYLKRRIYKLSLVTPGLCDDGLASAINTMKKKSLLVMEDIDSLFGTHREKTEQFSVTFSGFLNAIDGLGDTNGHIFIMTTNHPEKLDPAIRRHGRIDLEIEFNSCTKEQAKEMFLKFFPEKYEDATKFSENINNLEYTPAELQAHFISHRKSKSEDAVKLNNKLFKFVSNEYLNIYS